MIQASTRLLKPVSLPYHIPKAKHYRFSTHHPDTWTEGNLEFYMLVSFCGVWLSKWKSDNQSGLMNMKVPNLNSKRPIWPLTGRLHHP